MTGDIWRLLVMFYYVYLVVTIIYLLLDNRETAATFAWTFVLITFPVLGLIVYILIGRNPRQSHKHQRFQAHVHQSLNGCLKTYINDQVQNLRQLSGQEGFPARRKLFELLYHNSNSLLTNQNALRLFYRGQDKFDALIADLQAARHFIHMEYFIWRSDALTREIKDILIAKRREGVEVRILYDLIGSLQIKKKDVRELRQGGIQIYPYDNSRGGISWHSLNYRNHRKIAVIDGRVAYCGGMNMGQEYIDGGKRFASWRDTHARIEGEAVAFFQSIFVTSWQNTTEEELSGERYFPKGNAVCAYLPLQITTSGPDSQWSSIEQLYFNLINSAQECICIQSPYFIPSESIYKALLSAALGGIAVKIMVTGRPDRRLPYWAAFSFFESLLRAGVKIYHYEKGFMHAKAIVVDNEICTVGTANMDIRSFLLNYEVNMLIYDRVTARNLAEQFGRDLEGCDELLLSEYDRISPFEKFRNSIARLFAPLM